MYWALAIACALSVLVLLGGVTWRDAERASVARIAAYNDHVDVWNGGALQQFRERWFAVRGRNMSGVQPAQAVSGYLFAPYETYQLALTDVVWSNVSVKAPPAIVNVQLSSVDGVVTSVEAPAFHVEAGSLFCAAELRALIKAIRGRAPVAACCLRDCASKQ
jgi:hypothetical protein